MPTMGRDAKYTEGKTRPITVSMPEVFIAWVKSKGSPSEVVTDAVRQAMLKEKEVAHGLAQ